MNFSSKLLENAVEEFGRLPGVGHKTALRLVLHLLRQPAEDVHRLSARLSELKDKVQYCQVCRNISDEATCQICASIKRERTQICVVEDTRDVMAIEQTHQFQGLYHVLGGLISPMDGIGPADLFIDSLIKRVEQAEVQEVILALSSTMEGDTTLFYLYKKLKHLGVQITTIARGIAFGGELEYVDEVTLGRSIVTRVPYERHIA